jgi:hypothetical protein
MPSMARELIIAIRDMIASASRASISVRPRTAVNSGPLALSAPATAL